MSGRDELRLVHGGRDLIELLEEQLVKARAGELKILVIATAGEDHVHRWSWAALESERYIWARMAALVGGIQHDLMNGGL